ncbi:MAG: nucleotidyl transferase AbiEii/AbiGii toxin family protein [Candidatus Erginobacter occultus]|nr:nucleotidyl transferase AbiEii/AbiGii toxin family protein [Candidatus Erginobacter occultus]
MKLTRQDVLAHLDVAPWAQLIQVEQDLLLSLAMTAIFRDVFLGQQVAMRGGTALHKVHLAPPARYSEDIDLVLVGERPADHIGKALRRMLTEVLGRPVQTLWDEVKLTIRNMARPSKILRLIFRVPSVTEAGRFLTVKVEVNVSERETWGPMERIDFTVRVRDMDQRAALATYSLNEMLGTKMRALFQRRQGRDLFDLYWAMAGKVAPRGVLPDADLVLDAFRFYLRGEGTKVRASKLIAELESRVGDPGFCSDTGVLLRTGIEYDVQEAASLVRERLLMRL